MGKLNLSDTKLGQKRLRGNMTYFDKMVKDIRNKDMDAIQDWLHPDFLFVADFEMLTREDWLEETKKEFNRNEVTLHDNAECILENENIIVFEQKYVR